MVIDVLLLGVVVYGFFLGFKGGIVNAIFRVMSIFLALMAAFKFSPYMTEALEKAFNTYNPLMFIAGFIVMFFLTMWVLRWAGEFLTTSLEVVHVNLPNQIIGGVVLSFLFTVLYSLIIWFAEGASMISEKTKFESKTLVYLQPLPQKTFAVIGDMKPSFQHFFEKANQMMDNVDKGRMQRKETKTDIYDIKDGNNTPPNNAPNNNQSPPQ